MTYRPYNTLTASAVSDTRTNNSGVTINKATPVRINNLGELDFINVSVEAEAVAVAGVAGENIANGSFGALLSSGKVVDITTTAVFGDTLYIDKTGQLTNQKPSRDVNGFVSGDFVIAVGVIAKNENNSSLKDLIINIDIQGQL